MKQKLTKLALCLIFLIATCARNVDSSDDSFVNFNHLNQLTETIALGDELCNIVHIYAEYPEYKWMDASREGIACVDDVARAAVVHLRYYEITEIDSVLDKAKKLLNFILYMQANDGEFYNFINSDLHINKSAKTSRKSFNFWAARGYWALGFGYKVFKSKDIEYAEILKNAFLKCKLPLKKAFKNYPQFKESNDRKYPQWLVNKMAADATSTLLLGLVEFLRTEHDSKLEEYAIKLAEGIIKMQIQGEHAYNGAFLSWVDIWHAWGNAQTQALASVGQLLKQPKLIEAAIREADNFYIQLLVHGLIHEWQIKGENNVKEYPQISYDIRCLSLGLLQLYKVTSNRDYAKLAGLTASWLMGNNAAKTQMYDPQTGRCYDGINDSVRVNVNSGAESTIEALYTIIEISNNPIAKNYIDYKTFKVGRIVDNSNERIYKYRIFKNSRGERLALVHDSAKGEFRLLEGKELNEFFVTLFEPIMDHKQETRVVLNLGTIREEFSLQLLYRTIREQSF